MRLALLLLLAGSPALAAEPSEQALIYFNARMALREGRSEEAVKLWLLRNAVESETHRTSAHDEDFGSVLWAALGDLAICQDGLAPDDDGAGLWPVAMHNRLVRRMGRRPAKRGVDFRAFAVGHQQRRVMPDSVLSLEELRHVRLSDGPCVDPWLLRRRISGADLFDPDDRLLEAQLLLHLLDRSRWTLDLERVRGLATIEARRFDLNLEIIELATREARREAQARAREGRGLGMSREAVEAERERLPPQVIRAESEAARILTDCTLWPVSEWMLLSPDRRRFLFDHARAHGADAEQMRGLALGILDEVVAAGDGAEADQWIARFDGDPAAVWGGERGRRLLALDPGSGFGERAVIALHRGVRHLEEGDAEAALRSLALAVREAPGSRTADEVRGLARRWLSYLASRYEATEELLVVLHEILPTPEYASILEDLMWRAAFRADDPSFERGLASPSGRGALERRLALLRPLAAGRAQRFVDDVGGLLERSPSEAFRFLDELVQRLELEDPDVRAAQGATLWRLRELVRPILARADAPARLQNRAEAFLARSQALQPHIGYGLRDQVRQMGPAGEVYAGSVRVAPSDALPWPFAPASVSAPSVFEPLRLTPIEWRDDAGDLVFGWRIEG